MKKRQREMKVLYMRALRQYETYPDKSMTWHGEQMGVSNSTFSRYVTRAMELRNGKRRAA